MTEHLLPLTAADLPSWLVYKARERDDNMGAILALNTETGRCVYLQRRGAFHSLDPEYGNMKGPLAGIEFGEWFRRPDPSGMDGPNDILMWRASDIPADQLPRCFNSAQIPAIEAGWAAQQETARLQTEIEGPSALAGGGTEGASDVANTSEKSHPTASPAPVTGQRVLVRDNGELWEGTVIEVSEPDAILVRRGLMGDDWREWCWVANVLRILPPVPKESAAEALKRPPKPLHAHDWSDLPVRVGELQARVEAQSADLTAAVAVIDTLIAQRDEAQETVRLFGITYGEPGTIRDLAAANARVIELKAQVERLTAQLKASTD
jgi:hypothetical protein